MIPLYPRTEIRPHSFLAEGLTHSVHGTVSHSGAPSHVDARAAAARGLVRLHDLNLVLDRLSRARVPVLSFKGPVLDAELRGDPLVRDSEDLDLLVRREDLARASGVLGGLGWEPAIEVHPRALSALLVYGCEMPLQRPGRSVLDLHWDLAPAYFSWRPDREGIWGRARTVDVDGLPVPTLSRADGFLHLCAHGCLSDWTREIWVEDVALALGGLDGADADAVLSAARRTGGLRMVAVAVDLAERRFGAEGPAGLRAGDLADPVAGSVADLYAAVLDGTGTLPAEGPARTAFHLRVRERLRDRARHVAGILQTPSVGEWRDPPSPLPVRWARRIAGGLRRRSVP